MATPSRAAYVLAREVVSRARKVSVYDWADVSIQSGRRNGQRLATITPHDLAQHLKNGSSASVVFYGPLEAPVRKRFDSLATDMHVSMTSDGVCHELRIGGSGRGKIRGLFTQEQFRAWNQFMASLHSEETRRLTVPKV